MTIYSEDRIRELYSANNRAAISYLTQLEVFCGNEPHFTGLSGWVYEQTIQYCIRQELQGKKEVDISEQTKLGSRGKADLQIGERVAIEIKLRGLFSPKDITKYEKYRQVANSVGVQYLYLTSGESYKPYRDGIAKVIGAENTFFLDVRGDWRRFIKRLLQLLN